MEGIFYSIVGVSFWFVVSWLIAGKFQSIATMKGHPNEHIWSWCFWLGAVGWFMTIALPDLYAREKLQEHVVTSSANAHKADAVGETQSGFTQTASHSSVDVPTEPVSPEKVDEAVMKFMGLSKNPDE